MVIRVEATREADILRAVGAAVIPPAAEEVGTTDEIEHK